MNIVVTGGSGFIGRVLVRSLLENGHNVTILDRRHPDEVGVDFGSYAPQIVIGDIRDAIKVNEAISGQCEAIFHLAAVTSVLRSKLDPEETFQTNLAATHLLLEHARQVGCTKFIMASTNAVAGDVGERLINEETLLRPLTPYGATKAAAEMLMSSYSTCYDLVCTSIRFTNVYGVGMREKDSFIPRLMRAAMDASEIVINGDGLQVRDFLNVRDALQGLMLALNQDIAGPLTIGYGDSYSAIDLYNCVCQITKVDIPLRYGPEQGGEMRAVRVDIGRAKSLGYSPQLGLEEGLAETWLDFRKSAPV